MTANIKMLHACSFCGKNQTQVKTLVSGNGAFICNECVDLCLDVIRPRTEPETKVNVSILTPPQIVKYLDEHVIGQDQAKKILSVAIYNHLKRLEHPEVNGVTIDKSNVLMIGSSGVGKTHMVTALAKILQVPFAIVDATSLSQTGYVGLDPEECLVRLYAAAEFDVAKAQRGIIFIDEIDKIGRKSGENVSTTRDVSGEGVQQALLKIIEGNEVKFSPGGGRKNPNGEFVTIDTRNILFILGGAFDGLTQLIAHRVKDKQSSIGFGAQVSDPDDAQAHRTMLPQVDTEDLIHFGMIPELIGRVPVILPFDNLDETMLKRIMTEPRNAIWKQFQALFHLEGIQLEITDAALSAIAQQVIRTKTGARGLRRVLERILADSQYQVHELKKQGVTQIQVTTECVTEDVPPKYTFD
jgi:ATP-dependent Clp protease ATP-binding subunit ClpX